MPRFITPVLLGSLSPTHTPEVCVNGPNEVQGAAKVFFQGKVYGLFEPIPATQPKNQIFTEPCIHYYPVAAEDYPSDRNKSHAAVRS